ncbi:hypothetical protein niasHT_033618 [Heterodera trifolii]|uniref:Uncharacterized protein n=1 Tax=Heterodera trifolii TaxID=157864 RepID=A0ABD2I893_9BILA
MEEKSKDEAKVEEKPKKDEAKEKEKQARRNSRSPARKWAGSMGVLVAGGPSPWEYWLLEGRALSEYWMPVGRALGVFGYRRTELLGCWLLCVRPLSYKSPVLCVPIEFGTNFVHHLIEFSKPPPLNVPLAVMVLLILLQLCHIILTLFYGYRRRRRRPHVRFPTNQDQHHTNERKNEQFKKREEPREAENGLRNLSNSVVFREKPKAFPINDKGKMDGLATKSRNMDKPIYALASIPEEEEEDEYFEDCYYQTTWV